MIVEHIFMIDFFRVSETIYYDRLSGFQEFLSNNSIESGTFSGIMAIGSPFII